MPVCWIIVEIRSGTPAVAGSSTFCSGKNNWCTYGGAEDPWDRERWRDGTPLHRAAGTGVIDAVRILLAHGANLDARMLVDSELTPLMHAVLMQQPQMVRFLLDAGANRGKT